MPLISVIVPVFNGEKTIKTTIDSVLNQTFDDLELIVIDDGSKDSTLSVVSSVKDPRLKVFFYENAGVADSRNRGFSHASGEFISFLDADDLWTPDKLEAQLKALQENPLAAVAYSWVNYIDQSGQFLRAGNYIIANGDIYRIMLVHNPLENGSNPLIRRQAFAETGGFNQNLSPSEDWDMWLRLSARYHFICVPIPQILYRMSSSSASSNVLRMENAALKVVKNAFNQVPQSMQYLKRHSLATLYHYLTFKAVESPTARRDGLIAARFFLQALRYDLSALWQWKTMLKALFKIAVVILLTPKQSQAMLNVIRQILRKQVAQPPIVETKHHV
jgi:glycosyltransferase involved in cell wall biosynthesis